MPAMLVTAVGLGTAFPPMTLGAVSGVADHDAGIASALLNTAQQVGGAIGLAVLSTISTTSADDALPDADGAYYQGLATKDFGLVERAASALTDGYTAALVGAVMYGIAVQRELLRMPDLAAADVEDVLRLTGPLLRSLLAAPGASTDDGDAVRR